MFDYTISYSSGWPDWYVSEFYKFFHKKIEEKTGICFEYVELRDFNKQYNFETEISSDSVFGHYSLIIRCNKNGKLFVHSWYDHAFATLEWCERKGLDIVLFSGVSNITENFISTRKNVQPSVYCFEYWSDYLLLEKIFQDTTQQKLSRVYFAGLAHGVRAHFMETLALHPYFNIHDKSKTYIQKDVYYKEISNSVFGASFNGAANICYRDLELFGLKTINLRQPLDALTYEPLVPGVHYLQFFDNAFMSKVIDYHAFNRVDKDEIIENINSKIDIIQHFVNTEQYYSMLNNGREWYERNCVPEKQVDILHSFLKDFTIFE